VTVITGLVDGPFKNEQEFKRAVLEIWNRDGSGCTCFEIENGEKEPGMPDVLAVSPFLPAFFTEFKYSGKDGVIEFRKSQPLFYKRHRDLLIHVLAWDCRGEGRVVYLEPSEVYGAKTLRVPLPRDIEAAFGYGREGG
jgi:hypothetical protein